MLSRWFGRRRLCRKVDDDDDDVYRRKMAQMKGNEVVLRCGL